MNDSELITPRGFVNGLALSLAFWLGVVLTIVAFITWHALHYG